MLNHKNRCKDSNSKMEVLLLILISKMYKYSKNIIHLTLLENCSFPMIAF